MEGWIRIHRKIIEWEWFDDSEMFKLFMYLMLKANHGDSTWKGIPIKRSQLITGLDKLNRDTNISIQTLRTCLKRLENTGEINMQVTNKYRLVTLLKYDDYQDGQQATNNQANNQPTSNQQTTNKQSTANNNVKNDNNDNNVKKEEISGDDKSPPLQSLDLDLDDSPKRKQVASVTATHKLRLMFEEYYKQEKDVDYYYEAKDGKNLTQIISKIKFGIKKRQGEKHVPTEEEIIKSFDYILKKIKVTDQWVYDNLSIPNLNSKFKELIAKFSNKNKQQQHDTKRSKGSNSKATRQDY